MDVALRGAAREGEPFWTPFVSFINYDAKGQRTLIRYANGATTTYDYDRTTFRLTHLRTTRKARDAGFAAEIFKTPDTVQDLHYTYDPVGQHHSDRGCRAEDRLPRQPPRGCRQRLYLRPALSIAGRHGAGERGSVGVLLYAERWRLPRLSLRWRSASERSPSRPPVRGALRLRSCRQFPRNGASRRRRQLGTALRIRGSQPHRAREK